MTYVVVFTPGLFYECAAADLLAAKREYRQGRELNQYLKERASIFTIKSSKNRRKCGEEGNAAWCRFTY